MNDIWSRVVELERRQAEMDRQIVMMQAMIDQLREQLKQAASISYTNYQPTN